MGQPGDQGWLVLIAGPSTWVILLPGVFLKFGVIFQQPDLPIAIMKWEVGEGL